MTDAPTLALTLTVAAAGAVSLLVLFRLFQKHIDGRPLLEYEPRRPVPWGPLPVLLMFAPLLLTVTHAVLHAPADVPDPDKPADVQEAEEPAQEKAINTTVVTTQLWAHSLLTIVMAQACYVLLRAACGATRRDLGLPNDWRELKRDIAVGATAFAASLAPIYAVMAALNAIFEPESGHPLIDQLLKHHSWSIMGASAFAAVVAAPLYEETAFRLVFQGWLERVSTVVEYAPLEETSDGSEPVVLEPVEGVGDVGPTGPPALAMVQRSLPGWPPIVISGVLFGLAHWGHGVQPAALILLGVMLGYVYQRTHRITPCMVFHFLFNGFTFVLLLLQLPTGAE